jgi:hypothetical protein
LSGAAAASDRLPTEWMFCFSINLVVGAREKCCRFSLAKDLELKISKLVEISTRKVTGAIFCRSTFERWLSCELGV